MVARERLTDEQQRIVRHGRGPALVFAVAGAGKTTSLVHRVARLVEEGAVAPQNILASSFSRATAHDLEEGLKALGLTGVDCRTLHSLGRQFIKRAEAEHHWSRRLGDEDVNPSRLGPVLAGRALSRLARERDVDDHELDIGRGELEDQISAWKAQLCYADLEAAALPEAAREEARQAEHDNEDFVTLYRYYEEERTREGWVTFDDMLLEGWEALLRFDDLRAQAQQAYEQVLIDEFQDISRVQYQMLDVLTEPHRNYMAVGDDDQCIYEWRGADPSFILNFREEYGADEYLIRDTFRPQAPHTALANAVIDRNDYRREKHLNLTRGFGGSAQVDSADGAAAEAGQVADAVEARLEKGRALPEMVVLVRQYAQTPPFEQVFIDRDLPLTRSWATFPSIAAARCRCFSGTCSGGPSKRQSARTDGLTSGGTRSGTWTGSRSSCGNQTDTSARTSSHVSVGKRSDSRRLSPTFWPLPWHRCTIEPPSAWSAFWKPPTSL
jgi:DNA helicase-2/ATP-dependent DNA helicase PcrA